MKDIFNYIFTLLGTGAISVIAYAIQKAFVYLETVKAEKIAAGKAAEYNSILTVAKSAYYIGEEAYKLIPQAGKQKILVFEREILKFFPNLTVDQIEHFRQAVVGEINAEAKETGVFIPAPLYDPAQDKADVSSEAEVTPSIDLK